MLIYALLLLKCRESYLRAFLIHNLNFARLFARLTPVFLLKKRPSFARLFTKMSPSEELVTLLNRLRLSEFVQISEFFSNYITDICQTSESFAKSANLKKERAKRTIPSVEAKGVLR